MRSFTISMLAAITAISFIPEDAKVIVTGICLIAVLYVLSSHMVQHKQ